MLRSDIVVPKTQRLSSASLRTFFSPVEWCTWCMLGSPGGGSTASAAWVKASFVTPADSIAHPASPSHSLSRPRARCRLVTSW